MLPVEEGHRSATPIGGEPFHHVHVPLIRPRYPTDDGVVAASPAVELAQSGVRGAVRSVLAGSSPVSPVSVSPVSAGRSKLSESEYGARASASSCGTPTRAKQGRRRQPGRNVVARRNSSSNTSAALSATASQFGAGWLASASNRSRNGLVGQAPGQRLGDGPGVGGLETRLSRQDFLERRVVACNRRRRHMPSTRRRVSRTPRRGKGRRPARRLVQADQYFLRHEPRNEQASVHAQPLGHHQVVVAREGRRVADDHKLVAPNEVLRASDAYASEEVVDVLAGVEGAVIDDETLPETLDPLFCDLERLAARIRTTKFRRRPAPDDRDARFLVHRAARSCRPSPTRTT